MRQSLIYRVGHYLTRTVFATSVRDMASMSAVDPLNRRSEHSELYPLPAEYFPRQLTLVRARLIAAIRQNPEERLATRLADPDYAKIGERVVEYGWIARNLILDAESGKKGRLLDVGSVMNNDIVVDIVMECCDSIWFMNPAAEPLVYKERAAYFLTDPRKHFLKAEEVFDRVTCFSTLEHVEMNNLRYGGGLGLVTSKTQHPEEYAKSSLACLWGLTALGGNLVISVPFGPFEYLYLDGDDAPIYYTFDRERLLNLLSSISVPVGQWSIEIYKVVPNHGWVLTDIDDSKILPHAVQCVGAGGVAIASLVKSTQVHRA